MTKEEYEDFVLRYKGCGACFPMYHTLSRFEKMWFTAIQKDVAELEKENAEFKEQLYTFDEEREKLRKENAELKKNYEDSLVACGVLKAKVDTLAQPSPLESMQDTLIVTQKAQNEKQKEQLTEAREIISIMRHLLFDVWGYIAIPLEKRVNNFLKQSNS